MWKRAALSLATILALSGSLFADAKDDAAAAVKKLDATPNYAWTMAIEGGFGRPNTDCKTEKDGYTTFTAATQQDSYQIFIKGEKAVAKGPEGGWQTTAELQKAADDAGGFSPELITLLRIYNFQTPAAQAKDIVAKWTNVKAADGAITADLAEETAKGLMSFRLPAAPAATAPANRGGFGGGGGAAGGGGIPDITISNAKGTVTFWVKDGSIAKMAVHLTGSRSFAGGDEMPVDQTTTTEIKDVGTTKIEVPAEVKTKLAAK